MHKQKNAFCELGTSKSYKQNSGNVLNKGSPLLGAEVKGWFCVTGDWLSDCHRFKMTACCEVTNSIFLKVSNSVLD